MTESLEYGPLTGRDEDAWVESARGAFNGSAERIRANWEKCGRENVRAVRLDGRTVGGLIQAPMGQHFGGKRLGSVGIAAVSVVPEARGRGVARFLMTACLREARENGNVLSALYASTFALYRSVGYERAGWLLQAEMRLRDLPRGDLPLSVRAAEEEDLVAIEALSRERGFATNGSMERGQYLWRRLREPVGFVSRPYVVEDAGEAVGYLYLLTPEDGFEYLALGDWAARTPEALRTIRAFVATHGTIFQSLRFHVAPDDPFVLSLPERHIETRVREVWMLRLTDVDAALEQRGYPRGLSAELHLHVEDAALPENSGPRVLQVTNGTPRVTPGGEGRVRLDAGVLASLFSGHTSAESWRLAGRVQGDTADLEALTSTFAGPAPSMADFF